jgi:DegV family protein with EDD domain
MEEISMTKVALVTDSTSYIPQDLVKKHNITVIPQVLVWGNDTFRDGIDILPDEFYTRLKKADVMPSTSQAMPATFYETYQKLLDQNYEILTVVVSEKLSGTLSSALQAKDMVSDAPIEVVDSRSTAMAMGFMVLEAARRAEAGTTLQELKTFVEGVRHQSGVLLTVETLEFLHRGGRIGGGARFLGTALNIKPILELKDGRIEAVERVRTRSKAVARLLELLEDRVGSGRKVRAAALHANAENEARALLEQVNGRMKVIESFLSTVSPVVGTHVGPGTIGVAFLAED